MGIPEETSMGVNETHFGICKAHEEETDIMKLIAEKVRNVSGSSSKL
jgi:hypothetical protein